MLARKPAVIAFAAMLAASSTLTMLQTARPALADPNDQTATTQQQRHDRDDRHRNNATNSGYNNAGHRNDGRRWNNTTNGYTNNGRWNNNSNGYTNNGRWNNNTNGYNNNGRWNNTNNNNTSHYRRTDRDDRQRHPDRDNLRTPNPDRHGH
jgi:hypothetical protein